jgi:hypothetical protein
MGNRLNMKHEPSKKKGGSTFASKLENILTMRRATDNKRQRRLKGSMIEKTLDIDMPAISN